MAKNSVNLTKHKERQMNLKTKVVSLKDDISNGLEATKIRVECDNETMLQGLSKFKYITKFEVPKSGMAAVTKCQCKGNCLEDSCACKLLGTELRELMNNPRNECGYDTNGLLIQQQDAGIFECNSKCGCNLAIC